MNLSLFGKSINLPIAKEIHIAHNTEEDQIEYKARKRILKYHEFIEKLSKDLVVGLDKHTNKKKNKSYRDKNEESFEIKHKSHNRNDNKSVFVSGMQRFPPIRYVNAAPGSYDLGKPKHSVDVNIKGYGNGFLSKNDRFGYLPYLNAGPGPGQYGFEMNLSPIQKQPGKKRYGLHPPKIPHEIKVRPLPKKEDFPGPGNYEVSDKSFEKYSSSFKTLYSTLSPINKSTREK